MKIFRVDIDALKYPVYLSGKSMFEVAKRVERAGHDNYLITVAVTA